MMIDVPQHNTRSIYLSLIDLGWAHKPPLPLEEGSRVIFTAKEKVTDGDDLIRIRKTTDGGGIVIDDALLGEIHINLTPADTDLPATDYVYDIFVVYVDGRQYSSDVALFRVTPAVPNEVI